jgi:cytochrome c oxidase assembly protein subunit 15
MTQNRTKNSLEAVQNSLDTRTLHRYLATITLVSAYVLMLLGAYTSAIGAGLSCPDWPTCYGAWIPFLSPGVVANSPYSALQIFAEWAHRGLAMIVGLLILGTVVTAWYGQRDRPLIVWSAVLAIALLPVQVLLGGLTVTAQLQPVVVTSHLGVAILILVSLTVTAFVAWIDRRITPVENTVSTRSEGTRRDCD